MTEKKAILFFYEQNNKYVLKVNHSNGSKKYDENLDETGKYVIFAPKELQ